MRRQCKVDTNQPEIVAALRKVGCSVQHLHTVGNGCPDIVVGRNGFNYLLEIKDGSLVKSQQKLTKDEAIWHKGWHGWVAIVGSIDEALCACDVTRKN